MNFDPERIETELAEIQKKSTPTEARTVILNLVVVSDEAGRHRAERALGAVLGKRAARVIHIVDSGGDESDISLSARCYLDHERKSVCFQEVLIENGADGVGAAPGSWTPLLIRDIPVYVLWLTGFSQHKTLLDHVQEQADKLIIDSETAQEAGDTLADIHQAVAGGTLPEGFAVSDMTWERTLPLRRVTAHAFDDPALTGHLFELSAVHLSGGPPVYGALFLGWIASRLGWKPAGNDAYRDLQGRAVEAGQSLTGALEQGLSVTMSFFDREPLSFVARPDGCVDIEGAETPDVHEVIQLPSDGEMLLAEIDAARNESLYLSALGSTTS